MWQLLFGQLLANNGLIFIPPSGHTARECEKAKIIAKLPIQRLKRVHLVSATTLVEVIVTSQVRAIMILKVERVVTGGSSCDVTVVEQS